jgi:uncharacterized membrane protein YgdD (TMEM256/DUF423 family)
MMWVDKVFVVVAGLSGLAGTGLSAMAAHGPGGTQLDTAARFLLIHAAVLVGLAALVSAGALAAGAGRSAGLALVLGLVLFCGDLIRRSLAGAALFPMAAPAGGILLMVGWGLIALAALLPARA